MPCWWCVRIPRVSVARKVDIDCDRKIRKQTRIASLNRKASGEEANLIREAAPLSEWRNFLQHGRYRHFGVCVRSNMRMLTDVDLFHVRLSHGDAHLHFLSIDDLHEG